MAIKYEAMAKTGSYTDREGQQKNRWAKVGVVMENDKGQLSLKMETVPVGGWDGWISFFEPKEKDQRPQARPVQKADDDDVPWS